MRESLINMVHFRNLLKTLIPKYQNTLNQSKMSQHFHKQKVNKSLTDLKIKLKNWLDKYQVSNPQQMEEDNQ